MGVDPHAGPRRSDKNRALAEATTRRNSHGVTGTRGRRKILEETLKWQSRKNTEDSSNPAQPLLSYVTLDKIYKFPQVFWGQSDRLK